MIILELGNDAVLGRQLIGRGIVVILNWLPSPIHACHLVQWSRYPAHTLEVCVRTRP